MLLQVVVLGSVCFSLFVCFVIVFVLWVGGLDGCLLFGRLLGGWVLLVLSWGLVLFSDLLVFGLWFGFVLVVFVVLGGCGFVGFLGFGGFGEYLVVF